jgi:hypothetical protein
MFCMSPYSRILRILGSAGASVGGIGVGGVEVDGAEVAGPASGKLGAAGAQPVNTITNAITNPIASRKNSLKLNLLFISFLLDF